MLPAFKPSKLKKFELPYRPSPKAAALFKKCVVEMKEISLCKYSVRGMERGDILYLYSETCNRIFKRIEWIASKIERQRTTSSFSYDFQKY